MLDRTRLIPAVAMLVLAAVVSAASTGPDLPDTVMGQRVRAYLDVFNGGDAEEYRAFAEANRSEEALQARPMDDRVEQFLQFKQQWGQLSLVRVVDVTPTSIMILVEDANHGRFRTLDFHFEPAPPHGIEYYAIQPADDPSLVGLRWDDWDDLEDLLTQVIADTGIPGIAAAIVRDGRIVDQAAIGVREAGSAAPIEVDDRFHWGSVTKSVTGTVIGALVEQGLLDWTTTIAEALPGVSMNEVYRDVTIEQLMGHVAGIQPYTELRMSTLRPFLDPAKSVPEQRAAFVEHVLNEDPVNTPGTSMEYSNAGVTIAGHIAERIAGISWEELVEEHVFNAIGMTHAGFDWPRTVDSDQPSGHVNQGSGFEPMDFPHPPLMAPAGNVHSSVADFARYLIFHLNGLNG